MAYKLILSCLIEGWNKHFKVYIPDANLMDVDALRESIFEKAWNEYADTLRLLKIDVDPNLPGRPLPLLRFNHGEMSPEKTLSEVWPEPPPTDRINFFVRFTNPKDQFAGKRRLLEAANLVFHDFWGENKNLDIALHRVPGHDSFQYLTEEKVNSLYLGTLGYPGKALLIRPEYEAMYNELLSSNRECHGVGGVVVTGQPGIGKTCFLYYLLFRLLNSEKTVALQVNDRFVLFEDTGVLLYDASNSLIPNGTWMLTDSHVKYHDPCGAFLHAHTIRTGWMVQTTSLVTRWVEWQKEHISPVYYMDVFSEDELLALAQILGRDENAIRRNFNLWGPSARFCFNLLYENVIGSHTRQVSAAASAFTRDYKNFEELDQVSALHGLFVVRPILTSRWEYRLDVGSKHLNGFLSRAYAAHDQVDRLDFYLKISRNQWFGATAGRIFETYILLWFRHGSAQDVIRCTLGSGLVDLPEDAHSQTSKKRKTEKGKLVTSTPVHSTPLEIPVCRTNMHFFDKPEELKEVDANNLPKCMVPVAQNFATLDAFVITDNAIITVQMTTAREHNIKPAGFKKIYGNLPLSVRAGRRKYHVFLTDEEDKASDLLKKKHSELGIDLYSAFIGVNELDSSIFTTERVGQLIDDMAKARMKDESQGGAMLMDTK